MHCWVETALVSLLLMSMLTAVTTEEALTVCRRGPWIRISWVVVVDQKG